MVAKFGHAKKNKNFGGKIWTLIWVGSEHEVLSGHEMRGSAGTGRDAIEWRDVAEVRERIKERNEKERERYKGKRFKRTWKREGAIGGEERGYWDDDDFITWKSSLVPLMEDLCIIPPPSIYTYTCTSYSYTDICILRFISSVLFRMGSPICILMTKVRSSGRAPPVFFFFNIFQNWTEYVRFSCLIFMSGFDVRKRENSPEVLAVRMWCSQAEYQSTYVSLRMHISMPVLTFQL